MRFKMRMLPVNILWIWSICDCPVECVEPVAVRGGLRLSSTVAAMTLTRIKIFQDAGKGKKQTDIMVPQRIHWYYHDHFQYFG